jgi:hypothetical protein
MSRGKAVTVAKKAAVKKTQSKAWLKRFESFLRKALALRAQLEDAEAKLMYFLVDWEKRPEFWMCGDYPTFEEVIRKNCIIDLARYARFKRASKVIPIRTVDRVGVSGAIEASRILNPKHRDAMIIALDTFRKEQGTVASYDTARRYRKDITGEQSIPAPLVRESKRIELKRKILELQQEATQLKRELKAERALVAKLTKERDKLKQQLAKARKKK